MTVDEGSNTEDDSAPSWSDGDENKEDFSDFLDEEGTETKFKTFQFDDDSEEVNDLKTTKPITEDVPQEFDWTGGPPTDINLRNQLYAKIQNGRGQGESWSRRPLREMVQNCDDQRATQIHIHIDEKSIVCFNDGRSLSWGQDGTRAGKLGAYHVDENGRYGTFTAIGHLDGATAADDATRSGTFGTGLRSYHVFGEEIRIHTPLTKLAGGVPHGGSVWKHFALYCDKIQSSSELGIEVGELTFGPLTAFSDGYTKGFCFEIPWRAEVPPQITMEESKKNWAELTWDDIDWSEGSPSPRGLFDLVEEFRRKLPLELLGARHLKQAHLHVNLPSQEGAHWTWTLDKTMPECSDEGDTITMSEYQDEYNPASSNDPFSMSKGDTSASNTTVYRVFKATADEQLAESANFQPDVGLLLPETAPLGPLPSYTPMTLAHPSTEFFSAWACLPPNENRTKINVDATTSPTRWAWYENVCQTLIDLLTKIHCAHLPNPDHDNAMHALKMLPSKPPQSWFGAVDGISTSKRIQQAWERFTEAACEHIQLSDGTLLADAVHVNTGNPRADELYSKALEACGRHVLTISELSLLTRLKDWPKPPMEQVPTVGNAADFRDQLLAYDGPLDIDLFGLDLVRELIEITLTNPWNPNDQNNKSVPIVPDATGRLKPFLDGSQPNFFKGLEKLTFVLDESKRLHPDVLDLLDASLPAANFGNLVEVAREVSEAHPVIDPDSDLHVQVTRLLEMLMDHDDFSVEGLRGKPCIPVLYRDEISLQGYSRPQDGRHDAPKRDYLWNDPPAKRSEGGVHDLLLREIRWVQPASSLDDEDFREKINQKFKLYRHVTGGTESTRCRNLVMAFFFGLGDISHSLFHTDKDEILNIDRTFNPKPSKQQREEVLESILQMLNALVEANAGKMKTGWGNTATFRSTIAFLKDSQGVRKKVVDLSYEHDETLSELFGKSGLSDEHRALFGEFLTYDLDQGAGQLSGFGLSRRPDERTIRNYLGCNDPKAAEKSAILKLLLTSGEEWGEFTQTGEQVEDKFRGQTLLDMAWVSTPTTPKRCLKGCILPTSAWVELIGDQHEALLELPKGVDPESETVKARAAELGLSVGPNRDSLFSALMKPDQPWALPGGGKKILKRLAEHYAEDSSPPGHDRRTRLPNEDGTGLTDDAWLVEPNDKQHAAELFPDKRCVGHVEVGQDVVDMLQAWVLPPEQGCPQFNDYVEAILSHGANLSNEALAHVWSQALTVSAELTEQPLPATTPIIHPEYTGGQRKSLEQLLLLNDEAPFSWPEEIIPVVVVEDNTSAARLERFGVMSLRSTNLQSRTLGSLASNWKKEGERLLLLQCAIANSSVSVLDANDVWPFTRTDTRGDELRIVKSSSWTEGWAPELKREGHSSEFWDRCKAAGMPLVLLPDEAMHPELYQKLHSKLPTRWDIEPAEKIKAVQDGEEHVRLTTAVKQMISAMKSKEAWNNTSFDDEGVVVELCSSTGTSEEYIVFQGKEIYRRDIESGELVRNDYRKDGKWKILLLRDVAEDREIETALKKASNNRLTDLPRQLVRYPEKDWPLELDIPEPAQSFRRTLFEHLYYAELKAQLQSMYSGCQICGRATPANKEGEFSESVVSIFRKRGSLYRMDSASSGLGSVLYLCPSHRRSLESKLLEVPLVHEVYASSLNQWEGEAEIREYLREEIQEVEDEDLAFKVYEKDPLQGDDSFEDHERRGYMNLEHANAIRELALDYLEYLKRQSI